MVKTAHCSETRRRGFDGGRDHANPLEGRDSYVIEGSIRSQSYFFASTRFDSGQWAFERIHKLWLEISEEEPGAEIRHRDVVSVALCGLDRDFHSDQRGEILKEILREAVEEKRGLQSDSEPSED